MDIRYPKSLKDGASQALARGREPRKVILAYAGIATLLAAVLTLVSYWLSMEMSGATGLGNLGTRTMLSTIQTVLPIVQMVLLLGLELGYLYAMLRISRGQYADQTDLKMGFRRFWPLLRMLLLQAVLYFAIGFAVFYASYFIYMFTPWSEGLIGLLMPIAAGSGTIDDAILLQASEMMMPMMVIFLILYLIVIIPLAFRFRMAKYALLDEPGIGAMGALRASWKMTRRNCRNILKLDLSFWWYYVLSVLVMVLSYGDVILALCGVALPFGDTASEFLFYGAYLAAQFALSYFLRNRVEASYVMAYECIHEKPKDGGVVLGNIFDM